MSDPDPFNVPLPDFGKMNDGETLTWLGTDTVRWTRAWVKIMGVDPDVFEGSMLSWFANALEAGRSQGHRELGAAVNLIRTQEMLGVNILGDLDEAQEKLDRLVDEEPGPSLEEIDPTLIRMLRMLFAEFGAEGVRRTVVQLQERMRAEVGTE